MKAASTSTDLTDLIKSADDTPTEKKAAVKWTTARYKKAAYALQSVSSVLTSVAQGTTIYQSASALREYRDLINDIQVLIAAAGKKPSTKGKVKQ